MQGEAPTSQEVQPWGTAHCYCNTYAGWGPVTRHRLSSSEETGVEAPVAVPVELTSTASSTIKVIDFSSTEKLNLSIPGLGYKAERASRTVAVTFRDSRSRMTPADMARRMELRWSSAPPARQRPNHSMQEAITIIANRGSSPLQTLTTPPITQDGYTSNGIAFVRACQATATPELPLPYALSTTLPPTPSPGTLPGPGPMELSPDTLPNTSCYFPRPRLTF
jgi:hypothetical protein